MNIEHFNQVIHKSSKGGAMIYLSNCGHFVHRDDPRAVIANIRLMVDGITMK